MKAAIFTLVFLLLVGMVAASTTLSVIDSKYVTFDSGSGGPVWQVNIRGTQDSSYTVFGDNKDITGTVNGVEATAKEDFKLTQTIESESCEYSLVNSPRDDIYTYRVDKTASLIAGWRAQDFFDDCLNSSDGVYAWGQGLLLYDIYCLRETPLATAGVVQTGKINFRALFQLQKGSGTPIPKEITTISDNSAAIPTAITFSDGSKTVARISWIGGVTTGEVCPDPSDYVAIEKFNKWYTADKDAYTLYDDQYVLLQELTGRLSAKKSITSDEWTEIRRLATVVSQRANAASVPKAMMMGSTPSTISDAKAILTMPRDHIIYMPEFQMFLRADWLGVVYQVSMPEITDARFTSCAEGSSQNEVVVTTRNAGTVDGGFQASMTCGAGITPDTTLRAIRLKSGETGTLTLPFVVNLEADATKSCTVTVYDSLKLENMDRKTVSSACTASRTCLVEGERDCFGEIEKICTAGQWVDTGGTACVSKTCNRDGKCDASKGESFEVCGGKLASDNDCATCNLNSFCEATESVYSCTADCGKVEPAVPWYVYVLGGIGLAGAVYFGATMIKPAKGKPVRRRRR